MSWAHTVDQLEVVFFASLLAFCVVTAVACVVGTITYLLTREPAGPMAAATSAMPKVTAGRERHAAEPATAIAG